MAPNPFKASSRRDFVGQILGMLGCLPFAPFAFAEAKRPALPAKIGPFSISPEDDKFLNELEKANFQYFWEQTSPKTGLVKDRCNIRVADKTDKGIVGSIAATGFGLTALCIGERRGFISRAAAQQRVLATMMCLWGKLPHHRGFFYHWANVTSRARLGCGSFFRGHGDFALRRPGLPGVFPD